MVTVNPTAWGPAFWESQFGLVDFDAFSAAAGPLVDGFSVGGIRPPNELLLRAAYYAPGGGIGVYVAGRLQLAGDDPSSTGFPSWALAQLRAIQTEQDNTMATLLIPNAYQVSIQMEASGQPVVNVIGVTNAAGSAAGAAAAVKAAWEGATKPASYLSTNVAIRNYRAVDVSDPFGDIADLASTGTGGQVATPGFATLAASSLIQWNGSSRSRSTRGRLYFGPLLDSQINTDGRTLLPAFQTQLVTSFANFILGLSSAGYPLAVLSRKNSVAYPVTSSVVSSVIATQRRRLR